MGNYWGAQAYYYSGGPDGFGTWYTPPSENTSVQFTQRPTSDGASGTTIDEIHAQITNSQPAHLSALADQWQNMFNMLLTVWGEVWEHSNTLYTDLWKGGKARDQFMMTGPGSVLAYLDGWLDAAANNQAAIRAVSAIVQKYQGQMNPLWTEYEAAIQSAQHLSGAETAWIWSNHYNLLGGNQDDYNSAIAQKKVEQINSAKNQYNLKAQQLAWNMSQEMFDTYSTFSAGHGPLYEAPNAVMDDPNMRFNPPPGIGGVPGGPGGAPITVAPPPPAPAPAPAPTPPPGTPGGPPVAPPPSAPPAPPGAPGSPGAPGAPGAPGGPGSAPGAPASVKVAAPSLDPAMAALAAVAALHGGLPGGALGMAPPPGAGGLGPAGASNAFTAPRAPGMGGLISRSGSDVASPGRMGGMGTPAMPPGAAKGVRNLTRRPSSGGQGEPQAPGGRGRRSGARDNNGEVGVNHENGLESPFGGQNAPSTPPVLNNTRRGRPSGSTVPRMPLGDELGSGLSGRGDSVPPVLGRRAGRGTGPTVPSGPGRPVIAGEPTVPGAGTPVLRAPAPPLSGAGVSGLEEVPPSLRAPGASQRAAAPTGRRAAGPAELTNRNASRKKKGWERDDASEPSNLITDEEAFSVETPGGGVLTGRPDEAGYVAEAKAQVRSH